MGTCIDYILRQQRLTGPGLSLRSLGQKVFSRPGAAAAKEEETGWKESLYKFYKSGQQSMRVAVYGKKGWLRTIALLLHMHGLAA